MASMNVELKISGIEPMKNIVGMLLDYYEELPIPLQLAVNELLCEERKCWDAEYFESIGISRFKVKVIADGDEVKRVVAIFPDDDEILIGGIGIRKFKSIEVRNALTGEPIFGIGGVDEDNANI